MARKKAGENKIDIGNITDISGEVNIAGGDIYKGFTAEQVSLFIQQITTTFEPKKFDGRCPYKGLEVFEEEDAELFFGRERVVEDLLGRVKESRTVFITGPSGSGKSSLVRAGLLHALKQGAIKSSDRWLYETMKPGREPLKDLALAFSRLKGPDLADYFLAHAGEADVLHKCAESVLSGRKEQCFVLFIDQFEEVFTQVSGEEERVAFIHMLAHAGTVENGRVIVLFAMRSDFVSNCATYPMLNELLSKEFRQIGAMQPEELVSAIALPARHVGLPVQDELIARIINDMKGEPGALPLMQFALKDLFDSQQEKGGVIALTLEDYLKHGGIHKSLERHADNSFAKLSENEQELARSIFSGLIEIGRGTQDTRRTALFDELVPAHVEAAQVESVVQRLADARLIITDEQAGKDTVTISHEKLIDAWPWLKKLVNENRDVIALQNEIASDAKEWEDHKRDASYLYSGARLLNANEQLKSNKLVLSGTALEYIGAGQARQRRGRIALIGGISIIFALLVTAVIIFAILTKEAQKQTNLALARQLAAQAQSINATRNSKQMTAVLLATQSMNMFPSGEAAQVLLNSNFSARPISSMTHDGRVVAGAFSPNGKYVASGGNDSTVRIWDAVTGAEKALMTHEDHVNAVTYSPDGKYVASGSYDHTARVWDAATGKEVARMTHDEVVWTVAFSPDGKYMVSGSADGTARVWEAATGKEISRTTHDHYVHWVVFSPDGKYVASASLDGSVRVWVATTGEEVARMICDDQVTSVAFSPDGRRIVSGSRDSTTRVWNVATGDEIVRMTHDDWLETVAFSPDGKYVVSGSQDDTARLWDAETGEEVARMTHDNDVTSVAFSPNSRYVLSGSDDGTARVWDTITGKEMARMTHDGNVNFAAFSSDGKYAVSGSWDGTARVWETMRAYDVSHMIHDDFINSVAFSPDGKHVLSGSDDGTARVWVAATGEEVARMTHDDWVNSVAFSSDGKYVVSGSDDGTARVWDSTTGAEISRMAHDNYVTAVEFSPDGKYVVSGSSDATVRIWETATGAEIAHMSHGKFVTSVAFSPDGKYVASGGCDTGDLDSFYCIQSSARVWDAVTGEEVAHMTHEDTFYGGHETFVAFRPDSRYVVSASSDGTARVWETTTGREVARMTHENSLESVSFSPNGEYVVSTSWDGTARVWKVTTGEEVSRMTHDDFVISAAFNADGNYVVSTSFDGTVIVWEAITGKEVARLISDGIVIAAAFSPDGRYIVSGGEDSSARVWLWQAQDLIADACKYLPRNLTRAEWQQYVGDTLEYEAVCPNLPVEPEVMPTVSPAP